MDLVDDLLEVVPDQRFEQLGEAGVEPNSVKHRLMIGWPLHHPHQRLAAARFPGDIVEEVAMAEAAPVGDAFGVELVQSCRNLAKFVCIEEAADYRISIAPILRQIRNCAVRLISPQRLRSHDISPHPQWEDTSSL